MHNSNTGDSEGVREVKPTSMHLETSVDLAYSSTASNEGNQLNVCMWQRVDRLLELANWEDLSASWPEMCRSHSILATGR